MKPCFILLFSILFYSCSTQVETLPITPLNLRIKEISPDKWSAITKQNILHLAQIYDLGPLMYVKEIHLISKGDYKSLTAITLTTKFAEQPNKLLAVWLQEEFRFWLSTKEAEVKKAIAEIKRHYPPPPNLKIGAQEQLAYLNLIICYLQFRALINYLGPRPAKKILTGFVVKDKIYPWQHQQILKNLKPIKNSLLFQKLHPSFSE